MTAPAVAGPSCPKCGKDMWDQKNGKFPWKAGTPIFKCKDKECAKVGGVYWEGSPPKNGAPPVAQSVSLQQLPDFDEPQAPEKPKLTKLYLDATEFVLEKILPKFEEKEIGLSDTAVAAMIATVFIAASNERYRG